MGMMAEYGSSTGLSIGVEGGISPTMGGKISSKPARADHGNSAVLF